MPDVNTENPATETAGPPAESVLCCPSCGADFDASLTRCPYCGYVNQAADAQAFLTDLSRSEDAVRAMADLPDETLSREAKRTGRLIVIVLLVILLAGLALFLLPRLLRMDTEYERDRTADYLWLQEHTPEFQAAYEKGMETSDFTELTDLYAQAQQDDAPIWNYEHAAFARLLFDMRRADDDLAFLEQHEAAKDELYYDGLANLLQHEMSLYVADDSSALNEQEKEMIRRLAVPYLEDMKARYPLTDEDLADFRERALQADFVTYSSCEDYVEQKMKR